MGRHPTEADAISPLVRRQKALLALRERSAATSCGEEAAQAGATQETRPLPPGVPGGPLCSCTKRVTQTNRTGVKRLS